MNVVVFDIAEYRIGLPMHQVQEMVALPAITPVPKAPSIVEGVVDVRGVVIPVLDIRRRFGLAPRPLTLDQHLIIARTAARAVALRVDRAVEIIAVVDDLVESPAGIVPGLEYVAGIARLPDGLLIVHDLDSFLSVEESRALAGAVAGLPS
jgi:purine-binding chemotaxis protein CheW